MRTLPDIKQAVDTYLEAFLEEASEKAARIDPEYGELIRQAQLLAGRGGKRLRPYLSYLAYAGSGGNDIERVLPVLASQELFHLFLLIHDDIIDRDERRYGGPNLSGVYWERLAGLPPEDQAHFSRSVAMLAGDVLCNEGYQAILSADLAAELKVEILGLVQEAIFTVAGGELADTLLPLLPTDVTAERISQIYGFKTAGYTFEMPVRLGVLLAGRTATTVRQIRSVTVPLGVAYQLRDDLLGIYGSETVTGKPVTSDIREGKMTLLYWEAMQRLDEAGKRCMVRWYGNPQAEQEDLDAIRKHVAQCGAKAAVEARIEELTLEAAAALPGLAFSREAETTISRLISACKYREC